MLLETRTAILYGAGRSNALPQTWPPIRTDDGAGIPLADLPHGRLMLGGTVLGRLATLAEVADTAAFLAFDRPARSPGRR